MNIIVDNQVIKSIEALICSYIIYVIIKTIINKGIKKINLNNNIKGKKVTYTKLLTNILKYIFLVITILILLQINGIDVTSTIAGLGVAGVIVGFALQDALKDIIMGVNIITDNFFVVGDVVKYNNIEGKVIAVGLKTTKIVDIYTNNIISITNRNIEKIINISNWLDLDIPISYSDETKRIDEILKETENEIKKIDKVSNCEYLGINEFEDSSIIYKLRIYCSPEYKPNVKRAALRKIKNALDSNNIKIPYRQIDIHNI